MVDNETWIFPFNWSIESIMESNHSLRVAVLKLNNQTITRGLDTAAQHGYNFRIVLELWTYSNQSTGFQYGWRSGEEMRSAWLQIWFNLTLPASYNETEEAIIRGLDNDLLMTYGIGFKKPVSSLMALNAFAGKDQNEDLTTATSLSMLRMTSLP